MKLFIDSQNHFIESLLKQYFNNIEYVSQDLSTLEIHNHPNYLSIILKSPNQSWQLTKPISLITLINTLEIAGKILSQTIIKIGPIKFYPDHRLCKFKEEDIFLTQKETEILLYLIKHPIYIDKATLLNEIWGYSNEILTHTLETHISKLRSKFSNGDELIIYKDSCYRLSYIS